MVRQYRCLGLVDFGRVMVVAEGVMKEWNWCICSQFKNKYILWSFFLSQFGLRGIPAAKYYLCTRAARAAIGCSFCNV